MAINIIILLVVVCLLIISASILSYLKIVFDRILDDEKKAIENNRHESVLDKIQELYKIVSERTEEFNRILDENAVAVSQLKEFNHNLMLLTEQSLKESKDISLNLQNMIVSDKESSKTSSTEFDKVAYNDAVIAFQNVNNSIYSIRKYKSIAQKLLDSLYSGKTTVVESDYIDLEDDVRESIKSVESKLNIFNASYRSSIQKALECQGYSWNQCVRFPLNELFIKNWDENILGDDMDDNDVISRVVALGYEFPNSIVIGRIKTKVI